MQNVFLELDVRVRGRRTLALILQAVTQLEASYIRRLLAAASVLNIIFPSLEG